MTAIVHRVQSRVGDNWVGSSVVHLGDHSMFKLNLLFTLLKITYQDYFMLYHSFITIYLSLFFLLDVPNALMFIDKYTQISRILNPIIIALRRAADLMKDAELRDCIFYFYTFIIYCKNIWYLIGARCRI